MSWHGLIEIIAAAVLAGGGTPSAGTGDGEFFSRIEDHTTWLHVIEGQDHALLTYSGMFGPGCPSKWNVGWCRTCEMGFTRAEREGPESYLVSDEFGRIRLKREEGTWRLQRVEGQMGWCGVGWNGDAFGPHGAGLDPCAVVWTDARWYTIRNAKVVATDTGIERGSPVLAIASALESDHKYVMARAGSTVGLLKQADIRCDESGVGVWPPEEVRAVALYKHACDGGEAKGCDDLGKTYEQGRGVAEDEERAMALYQQACDGGYAMGCDHLGRMYHLGIGVVVDNARALALFKKACDGGQATGCRSLGEMYWRGTGVAKDTPRAVAPFKQACAGGDTPGRATPHPPVWRGTGVAKDAPRAVALYKQACDGGDAEGCDHLGRMYELGSGVAKDEARALALHKQACDGGYTADCTKIGEAYEQGNGVVKDEARAVVLYSRACEGGDAKGCRYLGGMYERGRGVVKDGARAASLYKQACDGGDAKGCTSLKRLGR